jgi:hypothetical protein
MLGYTNAVVIFVAVYAVISRAATDDADDRASRCRSYYDHVCRRKPTNETEGDRPSLSDWIQSRRIDRNDADFKSPILRYAHESCLRHRRRSSTEANREAPKKTEETRAYGPALVYETAVAIAKNNLFVETEDGGGATDVDVDEKYGTAGFPINAMVSKKLTSDTWCVDISPSARWISNLADGSLENGASIESNSTGGNLAVEISIAYDSESAIANAKYGGDEAEDGIANYARDYSDFGSADSLSPFWKDVLATLYPDVSRSTCLHLNGFSEFYREAESYVFDRARIRPNSPIEATDRDRGTDAKRSAACARAIKKYAPVSWNREYIDAREEEKKKRNEDREGSRVAVDSMMRSLKEISVEILRKNALLDEPARRFMENKMTAIRHIVIASPFPEHALPHLYSEERCLSRADALDKNETYDGREWKDASDCLALVKHRRDSNLLSNPNAYPNHVFYDTDASTINAWYDPTANLVVVPEGMLETPFFSGSRATDGGDEYESEAVETKIYSDMGMILGHELWHSVDVHGLCWDENGNYDLSRAFCSEGRLPARFVDRLECLKKDYGHPCGFGDDYGDRTLGEDMADHFGTLASFLVFREKSSRYFPVSSNDTAASERRVASERRFFKEFAQMWCQKKMRTHRATAFKSPDLGLFSSATPAIDAKTGLDCKKIEADVHAIPKHRVDKTLKHLKFFSEVFGCPSGSPMNAGNASCSLFSSV